MEPEILKDFHEYGANLATREIFLHNHYHTEDNENPGVEYRMSNTFIKNLRALDSKNNSPIVVHMQSIGGEWDDGMAMYDAITMCRSYVTILAYGQASSMSSIIFQAADLRLMTINSHFMCHYGSSGFEGSYLDNQSFTAYDKRCADKMFDIYASKCVNGQYFKDKFGKKPTEKQVKQFLIKKFKDGNWYLTSEEATYYGFCDGVIKDWNELNKALYE
jgi:ATP-dependent protease ClpP protease subunit